MLLQGVCEVQGLEIVKPDQAIGCGRNGVLAIGRHVKHIVIANVKVNRTHRLKWWNEVGLFADFNGHCRNRQKKRKSKGYGPARFLTPFNLSSK